MGGVDGNRPEYTDVTCTACGRHNRIAHMVGLTEQLRLCSVCVSKVGAIMDAEAGVVGPEVDWPTRWPLKRVDAPAT
jgi:hypothetical protein